MQKLIATPGYLSAILTIRLNKHNLFRNFSESIFNLGTKLARIVYMDTKDSKYYKIFLGNYIMAMVVEHI